MCFGVDGVILRMSSKGEGSTISRCDPSLVDAYEIEHHKGRS